MAFEPKPFGKYFLMERIAVGGMAEIYKAKTFGVDGFEKLLAIKKILPNYSADKEFIAMLTDEAKLVVKLSHTNIVQIYDLGKVGDDYYISMEYIDGVNLREVINRGKELKQNIPLPLALFMGSEIASGLDYAHGKRDDNGNPLEIVHRDISPQNILLSFEGETKIVDFGIAKAAMNVSHTTAGILKGKVTYMSPEQASGQAIDGRTDIYSAGILLYEMITGERLFTGESQFDILNKIREADFTEENLSPKIPKEVRPILIKALAKKPEHRYETAADFQIALTKLLYSKYDDFSPKQLGNFIQKWFSAELKIRKQQSKYDRETENQTRSVLLNKMKSEEEVLAHNESVELPILQDTTKPEAGIKPEDLDHGDFKAHKYDNTSTSARLVNKTSSGIKYILGVVIVLTLSLAGYFLLKPKNTTTQIVEATEVEIISIPDDAHIVINGNATADMTPTVLTELKPQTEYQLRLVKEGYEPYTQTFTLENNVPFKIEATLIQIPTVIEDTQTTKIPDEKKPTVDLSLSSIPTGASIFVDNTDTGLKTPAKLEKIAQGKTFSLKLVLPKYLAIEETITASKTQTLEPLILLPDPQYLEAELNITTNVSSPTFFINGKKQDGLTDLVMTQGNYTLRLVKEGYLPIEKKITISGGENKTIDLPLEKKPEVINEPKPVTPPQPKHVNVPDAVVEKSGPARLRVDSSPRGAAVMVDGKKAGITPVIIPGLASGSHNVSVSLPGYKTWNKTITMGGKSVEISAPLLRE